MITLVKVGAGRYRVQVGATDSDKLGTTNTRHQRINISPDQSPSSTRDTMLHEALHALWYESSANLLLNLSDEDEERMIRVITPWLLMMLRDNPKLLALLLAP